MHCITCTFKCCYLFYGLFIVFLENRVSVMTNIAILTIFACGALAASISVGIVIPSTWFVYLYKQTVNITVVVLSTVIKTGTTAQIE